MFKREDILALCLVMSVAIPIALLQIGIDFLGKLKKGDHIS